MKHRLEIVCGENPAVRRFQPDAILLDIAMPKMSGHDVAREVRRQFMAYRPHPGEALELLAPLIGSPGRN